MYGHTGFLRSWGRRRRGLLAVVGTVLALAGVAMALAPPPSSQAATGTRWSTGVQHTGVLRTNTGTCTVTVISEWLAITAKHCGWVRPHLKLNVAGTSSPGEDPVKKIEVNRDWDVEAIILWNQTCCRPVTPNRGFVTPHDPLSAWGYGRDRSNNQTNWLYRADFPPPRMCPNSVRPDQGSLCWENSATNSLCTGDSGAPILQNSAIVGMATSVRSRLTKPDGGPDCSTVYLGQAIRVSEIRNWLDQMILEANPFS